MQCFCCFPFNSTVYAMGRDDVSTGFKSCSEPCLSVFIFSLFPTSQMGKATQVHSMGVDDTEEGGAVFHIWLVCPWKRMVGGSLCPWQAVSGDWGNSWYPYLLYLPCAVRLISLLLTETATPASLLLQPSAVCHIQWRVVNGNFP